MAGGWSPNTLKREPASRRALKVPRRRSLAPHSASTIACGLSFRSAVTVRSTSPKPLLPPETNTTGADAGKASAPRAATREGGDEKWKWTSFAIKLEKRTEDRRTMNGRAWSSSHEWRR